VARGLKVLFLQNLLHCHHGVMSLAAVLRQAGHRPEVAILGPNDDPVEAATAARAEQPQPEKSSVPLDGGGARFYLPVGNVRGGHKH